MSELFTTKQMTELLKISKTGFYNLMDKEGAPQPIILGSRKMRWKPADIMAWLEAR